MLTKCIGNCPRDLPDAQSRLAFERNIHQDEVGLVVGRQYVVYGIAFREYDGLPWYLVCEEEGDDYPSPHLGSFFKVLDGAIPEGWEVATRTNVGPFAILPSRWARDPGFLERLVNAEPHAVAFFQHLRERYEAPRRND